MISVVIPAYNEEQYIGPCLESFARQVTREPFEVIVVDNGSTDRTAAIARSFQDRLSVKVVNEALHLRGAVRQTGLAAASGDLFACTDADSIVPPTWIDDLRAALDRAPALLAVTGSIDVHDGTPFQNAMLNFFIPVALKINRLRWGHPGLSGGNCVIRREIYERAGGFDRTVDAYEDVDLAQKIHALGKIGYRGDIVVTTSARRFRKGLLRGWFDYLHSFAKKYWMKKDETELTNVR